MTEEKIIFENQDTNIQETVKKSKKKPPLTLEEKQKEKIKRQYIRQFQRQQTEFLLVSVFNEKTSQENEKYRKTNPIMESLRNGACYCSPIEIKKNIPYDSFCYIIEMHNHINKIAAIGRIKAKPRSEKHNIYEDKNYHRFYYLGKYRIKREDMTKEEDEIMKILDILCFTGNTHMKRNQGLKCFPNRILYDLKENPNEIFNKNKYFKLPLEKKEIKKESLDLLKKIQNMFSMRNYI